jgi:hypothetical protein
VAGDAASPVGQAIDDELDLLIPLERAHPVSVRPPMPTAVDTYRQRLEDMTAEAMEEYYLHSAGHKPTYEIAAVYERYADLTTLEQARALGVGGAPTELYRFACEAYIGNGLRHLSERVANAEAALVVEVDGDSVPYREVSPRLVNEPDRERRQRLYAARQAVTAEHLNPLHEEDETLRRDLAEHLNGGSVLALYDGFGYAPQKLMAATNAFLDSTDDLYHDHVDRQLRRRLGVPLAEAGPPDLARLWRAPEFDAAFAPERALPALRATLAGLGVDLGDQPNVELDIEARPGKVPRAFCAPIRVPGRVILVLLPQGGQDDYRALFHEAGHTEHFAHIPAGLPAEDRVLGDNAVTEGFAFLFEHLLHDPHWLRAHLGAEQPEYTAFSALYKLFLVRRYAAKLAYEIELHSGAPLAVLPARYTELLSRAAAVPYPATDYLVDVDEGFYCTCYLRAWALEAQLRDHLRRRFGGEWFGRREAGALLRELWSLGQSLRAEALLRAVTGDVLDFDVLRSEAEAALAEHA